MRRITLDEFAAEKGQARAAALLGLRQGSLSKALRTGREIYVTESEDGTYSANEVKPFPAQLARTAAE